MKLRPVVIIGAPRSGTNMLRDVLASFDGVETWPCDEINYIWRHGNIRHHSDEFPPQFATDKVKKYLQKMFKNFYSKTNAQILVEKTCANSLRVSFINEVFPESRFIFIYRDGIDATGSAKLRWTAKLDLKYILEKVRFVPKMDLPYYGVRYLWARLYRFFSKEKRLAFWGPALDDMQSILTKHKLNEVCALQWKKCVDRSEADLSVLHKSRVFRLRYEDFVNNPTKELSSVLEFVGLNCSHEKIEYATQRVSNKSLGKGRVSLGESEVKKLEILIGDTLERYDYL
mgnify:CR=1 FL=1